MKKILLTSFIVALGLLGASCKDDNSTAGGGGEILPDQQVSCEIFMPTVYSERTVQPAHRK